MNKDNHPIVKKQTSTRLNLTPKQKLFAQFYAISNNASDAASKAGYVDKSNGVKMLRKPHVSQYVAQLRKQMIEQYIVHYQFCVMQYKQLLLIAKQNKDYQLAMDILQKISKLREPMAGNPQSNSGEIKIIIGTNQNKV